MGPGKGPGADKPSDPETGRQGRGTDPDGSRDRDREIRTERQVDTYRDRDE